MQLIRLWSTCLKWRDDRPQSTAGRLPARVARAISLFRLRGFVALREDWLALDAYAGKAVALMLPMREAFRASHRASMNGRVLLAMHIRT